MPLPWLLIAAMIVGFAIAAGAVLLLEPSLASRLLSAAFSRVSQAFDQTTQQITQSELSVLRLDIAFPEYQALSAKREQAMAQGVLQLDDDDWGPAQTRHGDKTFPVRLRLKGDWLDHL